MGASDNRDGSLEVGLGKRLAIFVAVYGPAFGACLLPALVNGFPLVYSDSGTYITAAIERFNPVDRPVYYSVFIGLLHWGTSLWPVVLLQAAAAVGVTAIFLRRSLTALPNVHLALLLLLSTLPTSLPVFVSQITPDFFTPLMVLSLCVLFFHHAVIGAAERWFLLLTVLVAICSHQANFLIAAISIGAAFFSRWMSTGRFGSIRPSLAPVLVIALGIGLLLLPNYVTHRVVALTRGSSVFFLAKAFDTGTALDYLRATCPTQQYSVCSQVSALDEFRKSEVDYHGAPLSVSDYFLWGGPLDRSGGWDEVRRYAGAVSLAAIERDPATFIVSSLRDFGRQLVRFETGDGLDRYSEGDSPVEAIRRHFPHRVNQAFLNSRQETIGLPWDGVSKIHYVVVAVSALVFLVLLITGRVDPIPTAMAFTLVAAVIGNAFVTGVLSAVHDRYQGRITCLLVSAALILGYRRWVVRNSASIPAREVTTETGPQQFAA